MSGEEIKRGIVDRIKFDGPESVFKAQMPWLVYKYPYENITIGAQLIVHQSQEVVFFKDGIALDVFGPGRHTLNSANVPLLQKLINKPFGGKTPFTAEVYFINKAAHLNMRWGTTDPVLVQDPEYNIAVHLRGYGQMGFRIADSRSFLMQIIGALHGDKVINQVIVEDYFRGLVLSTVRETIAHMVMDKKVSLFNITASLRLMSDIVGKNIKDEFKRFGIEVINFFIESINVPDEDIDRLQSILEMKAEFDLLGDDRYVRKRSFDVLEKAAEKGGNGLAGAGMGIGMGVGAGIAAGNVFYDISKQLHITSNKNENGVVCNHCNAINDNMAKFCNMCGAKLSPKMIICKSCNYGNRPDAQFCINCGAKLNIGICPNCGHSNFEGSKYCSSCGTKLEE